MKKIVKLTEEDIVNIVTKVINESDIKDKLKNVGKNIKQGVKNIKDKMTAEKSEFELSIEELEKDGWWPVGWEKENFLDGIEDKEILTSELVGRDLDRTIKKNKENIRKEGGNIKDTLTLHKEVKINPTKVNTDGKGVKVITYYTK